MEREDVIKIIAKSSIYGNLGLFIGAGMSKAILDDDWIGPTALSWKELIYKCAEAFEIDFDKVQKEGVSYPDITTQIALLISKKEENVTYEQAVKRIKEKIAELTCWYPNQEKCKKYGGLLEIIAPDWIITTNYDLVIECLLTGRGVSLGPNDQLIASKELIPIYHLHGIRTNPDSIVITQEDYISLFRPNQYRQQRLPLLIKESTTVLIGYSLGDVNVLTSVDWAKNVYSNQRVNYPHEIIQLLYKEDPQDEPYRDKNDILILEFNNLEVILGEIVERTNTATEEKGTHAAEENSLHDAIRDPNDQLIDEFIDNAKFREGIIEATIHSNKLISGFLILLSKAFEKTWERAAPRGAFNAYNQNLILSLDILQSVPFEEIPPALLELIAYNLNKVATYVGSTCGQSIAAHKTWSSRKANLADNTKKELQNIALTHNFHQLGNLMRR